MAKNSPEMIWIIRQRPNKDPKFQKNLMFVGEGRVIRLFLMMDKIG
jgi:hypothetical protein